MSLLDLSRAIELVKANKGVSHFAGPQPEGRVRRAQELLGLTFPPSYLEFVRQLGCGNVRGAEFYGVVSDDPTNSSIPDGVWATLAGRKDGGAPDWFITIGVTGDGGEYVIDTSRRNDASECPVLEWWPGFSEVPENGSVVATDFGEFFLREVEESLAREIE